MWESATDSHGEKGHPTQLEGRAREARPKRVGTRNRGDGWRRGRRGRSTEAAEGGQEAERRPRHFLDVSRGDTPARFPSFLTQHQWPSECLRLGQAGERACVPCLHQPKFSGEIPSDSTFHKGPVPGGSQGGAGAGLRRLRVGQRNKGWTRATAMLMDWAAGDHRTERGSLRKEHVWPWVSSIPNARLPPANARPREGKELPHNAD